MTLRNRKILITRRAEQSRDMIREIEARGGTAVVIPMIMTAPPPSWEACDDALSRLASFDLLVFTSVNAVESFVARARARGVTPGMLERAVAVAVGEVTARALRACGMPVHLVPATFSSGALAGALGGTLAGKRVLLPRGSMSRETVAEALRASGATVESVTVYVTAPAEETGGVARRVLDGEFDVVTFASPSAAAGFGALFSPGELKDLPLRVRVAVIGATTADAARSLGLPVDIIAAEATARGMVRSIDEFFPEGV